MTEHNQENKMFWKEVQTIRKEHLEMKKVKAKYGAMLVGKEAVTMG